MIEVLGPHHFTKSFSCGEPTLDGFIQRHALNNQRRNYSKTYVEVDRVGGDIQGFYSLSSGSASFDEAPMKITRGLPRYPVPIVVIGRLAVSQDHQGKGVGDKLLRDALRRVVVISENLGIAAVVVDCKSELVKPFYERFGFRSAGDQSLKLFLKTSKIVDALPRP